MHGPLFDRLQNPLASSAASALTVESRSEGLYLRALDLFLDPIAPVPRAFVSHAHADHANALHPSVATAETAGAQCWMSRETDVLLRARYGDIGAVSVLAWDTPERVGNAEITLVRAGHILGAASLFVRTDAGTLLYTGDVKRAAGLTHPAAKLPACDVLVVESTFGLPIFSFPDDAQNHDALTAFARDTLAAGETPVVLAYALGKGQEVARLLGEQGIPVRAHGAVARINEAYRALGVDLPNVRPYDREDEQPPGAIVVPPRERFGAMFKRTRGRGIRVAYVSGWALLDASRERYDADLQVPWSDHASFRELESLVESCAPKRVYVAHGFAEPFARHLRRKGFDATALEAAGFEA